jgi:hypothetical protein
MNIDAFELLVMSTADFLCGGKPHLEQDKGGVTDSLSSPQLGFFLHLLL